MDIYERPFDWVSATEGRARFAGGIRSWDERGHDIYAADVDGKVMYGEIARTFLPNQDDFNISRSCRSAMACANTSACRGRPARRRERS
ncbi:hypothetical protein [Achromobacter dolens]|uniref:hypothetical protein n=1 Tax=Achromobacter dolens TaxID=1287738 RepID=UPI001465C3B6|nr:hypothetical protein [Achromobacter dolens]CAB3665623.1 hypothetical protein LMG26840_03537 [Achromobacter dolens]